MKKTILAIAAMIFLIGAASADAANITVTYNTDPLEVEDISGIIESLAFDYDMIGMTVDVGYQNDTNIYNYVWGDLGSSLGSGVTLKGDGTLSLDGDSFYNSWILNTGSDNVSDNIDYIIINALSGNAVFDVGNPESDSNGHPIYGTPGSEWGIAFNYQLDGYNDKVDSSVDIDVKYSHPVGVGGLDPVGDLYGQLEIDFVNGYFDKDSSLEFVADTDSVAPVPEPGTMLLLGLGLAGLIGYKRKRNGNKG